jgi:hypothetical protein
MRVTEYERAPGANEVEVFAAIDVPDSRALAAIDDERRATHGAKRANGTVHAADKDFLSALEDFGRARTRTRRFRVTVASCCA